MLMDKYDYNKDIKVQSKEAAEKAAKAAAKAAAEKADKEATMREQGLVVQLATKLFQLNDAEGFAKLQTASLEETHEMCRKFGIIK